MCEERLAKEIIILIFILLVTGGLAFMWGYEVGYEGCLEDLKLPSQAFIQYPFLD